MDLDLSGKTALVMGASQGIGKACAQELALLGCKVVVAARNRDKLALVVADLEQLRPGGHAFFVADTSDRVTLQKQTEAALQQHGGFDILVLNTGGAPPGPIIQATEADFAAAFGNYLQAAALLVRLCLPFMQQRKFGRILNILSTAIKAPIYGLGVSSTARAAVAAWAKTLALEVGPSGITVNSVLPGAVDTERLRCNMEHHAREENVGVKNLMQERIQSIPLRRIATPREVGSVVAFLATPAASYVTGVAIPVDGGALPCL